VGRRLVLIVGAILAILAAIWWFRYEFLLRSSQFVAPTPTQNAALPSPNPAIHPAYSQIDLGSMNRDQVANEVRRRDGHDNKWEWKTPIKFYGKAIDEKGQPVAGADVHFQWTNLSAKGTEERRGQTDSHGLFSLDDVSGKRLVVRVTKSGYYDLDSRNRFSFEYANPFEKIFYQPNANRPILFYLRKQNPNANIISKSVEIVLPGDGTAATVDLDKGKINPTGELLIQAWKPWPPRPMSPLYEWKVLLHLPGSGFVETREDFAFEAPESGYEESYIIDMNPGRPSEWKVSAERTLYFTFGKPKKYGRMALRTDGNSRYVFLDYIINPTGSRNLEPNAAESSSPP
jgi:hypothetical protein